MNLVFSSVNKTKSKSSLYSTTPIIESSPQELIILQTPFVNKVSNNNIIYNMISRVQYNNGSCSKCGMN